MSEAPAHITFDDAMKFAKLALEIGYRSCQRGESISDAMMRLLYGDPSDRLTINLSEVPGMEDIFK